MCSIKFVCLIELALLLLDLSNNDGSISEVIYDFDHYLLQQQTMDDMLGISEKMSLDNNTASIVGQWALLFY